MKIRNIHIQHYKRFTDLTINGLPETAKLVVLVGPNGCGKTSLFEAFNYWYRLNGYGYISDIIYSLKKDEIIDYNIPDWYVRIANVSVEFFDAVVDKGKESIQGRFYFRSAYRNEADFSINSFTKQPDPRKSLKENLMSTDMTVSSNFQRLVSHAISGVFKKAYSTKPVEELREELIGRIRDSLHRVFGDLILLGVGEDPLNEGSFFFKKGTVEEYHYKNLSAGEKSAFDLILDLIIKSYSFPNAIYCIDEPEAHMHTHLQSLLLKEIYDLIPTDSQLWISTHSLGMLRKAQELEEANPGTVVFLDFDGFDFDTPVSIHPSTINKTILKRFMELALDDFAAFIAPQHIVFCEGNPKGHATPSFDAQVYTIIFGENHPNVAFVSAGSCSEVVNKENVTIKSITEILSNSKITRLVDRDDLSNDEVKELKNKGVRALERRYIESYLFDDEVIKKLCESVGHPELFVNCSTAKYTAIQESIKRKNPIDDIKSASGAIMVELKRILSLTQCGNTRESFILNTLAPLIAPGTTVYSELEKAVFA